MIIWLRPNVAEIELFSFIIAFEALTSIPEDGLPFSISEDKDTR